MKKGKKIICALLAAIMFAIPVQAISASNEQNETENNQDITESKDILFGDADNDHCISVHDATLMQRLLAEFDEKTVLDIVPDITILDFNGDGAFEINDVVILQRYIAVFGTYRKPYGIDIGDVIYKWHDAVYETTYETTPAKTEMVKVIDRAAYSEEVDVIDPVNETEQRCIYRSGRSNVCNDCGMTLLEDNGKPMSNADAQQHLTLHCGGVFPATAHAPLRYVVDGFGNKIWVRANSSVSIYTGEKDENGKYITEEVFYNESLPLHNYGAYGSYSNNKQTDKIPTGEMETIRVSDFVPVYKSGEAYFCKRCGKIMYFEDGQEYDVRDMARHVMKECPLYKDAPPGTIGVEKKQTDKIPTGQFTDIPKHTHKETINYPEEFHMEEIIIEPETIIENKVLVSEGGYERVF